VDLGQVSFEAAFERQEETVKRIADGNEEELVHLLEHPHVFTIGRAGVDANLLRTDDAEGNPLQSVRINRGGDITYHGPGQLVVYPHLDLRKRNRDLHRFLRSLEESAIRTAAEMGISAFRRDKLTGVWTEQGKLASIGVGVRLWITMHGLALNVNTDLGYFDWINPCGMPDCPVTSLKELLGRPVSMRQVKEIFRCKFIEVFENAD
jgi:lipoyl(octanoyl) transferase